MLHYRNQRLSLLEQPDMQWFMPHQNWLAESHQGTFFHDRQVLNLHQKVQVHRKANHLSNDHLPNHRFFTVKTDYLDFFLQEDRGYTEAEVEVFTDLASESVKSQNIQHQKQSNDSSSNHSNSSSDHSNNMVTLTARGMQLLMTKNTVEFLHQVKSTWSTAVEKNTD